MDFCWVDLPCGDLFVVDSSKNTKAAVSPRADRERTGNGMLGGTPAALWVGRVFARAEADLQMDGPPGFGCLVPRLSSLIALPTKPANLFFERIVAIMDTWKFKVSFKMA